MPGTGGGGLFDVVICGIRVSKALHAKHPAFPKAIPDLAALAEEAMSNDAGPFRIYFHPRNYKADAFIGEIENYSKGSDKDGPFSGTAHIYYDRDQNVCWRRFVVAKEICHILYAPDSIEHLTGTPEEVEQLINKIMAGVELVNADHATSCDSWTMLMALEILLPHHERDAVDSELANGKSVRDMALKYRLPEHWVRFYLSPDYKKLMDACYEAL